METCVKCKRDLPEEAFSPSVLRHRLVIRCRECNQANKKRKKMLAHGDLSCARCNSPIVFGSYRRVYCSQACGRRAVTLRVYGLAPSADIEMLEEQEHKCAACREPFVEGDWMNINVDHCHTTGAVRGLLCTGCNSSLGLLNEDPERLRLLADYAEAHSLVEVA